MRKLLISTAIASSLLLGGCATTLPDGTAGAPLTFQQLLKGVQDFTIATCGLAPTGEILANLLSTVTPGGGVLVTAAAIGSAFCQAIVPPKLSARRGGAPLVKIVGGWRVTPGRVNGVPVQ